LEKPNFIAFLKDCIDSAWRGEIGSEAESKALGDVNTYSQMHIQEDVNVMDKNVNITNSNDDDKMNIN
jgi:hypothetical protein